MDRRCSVNSYIFISCVEDTVDDGRVVEEGRPCQAMACYLEERAKLIKYGDGMVV